MIISTDRTPSLEEFEALCQDACAVMNDQAEKDPDYYISKGAQKLEVEVKKALDMAARGTGFEGTIQIISGQRFPDIVAHGYYGVEVKSTKEDKWTLIGGSVAEGTRVEDVEHIFFLFGKLRKPVQFKTRRYEECLCDIAVTHSPRYRIDMNLAKGETIFDKMGVSYDDMRRMDNPIRPVVEYFRSTLKPGESLWWVNGEEHKAGETSVPPKIRLWKTLSSEEKDDMIAQGFALFPELFGKRQNKYERFTLWLVANHGIVSTSMRDSFSAGGKKDLKIADKLYKAIPQKFYQLSIYRDKVKDILLNTDKTILARNWDGDFQDPIEKWIQLVCEAAKEEDFDVSMLLEDMLTAKQGK
ncbi:hypothetical protein LI177_12270 [bacterium 210820-DFI.6.37]|nr:hypothetical protein [bacterium 210820-DFI.6.37]